MNNISKVQRIAQIQELFRVETEEMNRCMQDYRSSSQRRHSLVKEWSKYFSDKELARILNLSKTRIHQMRHYGD